MTLAANTNTNDDGDARRGERVVALLSGAAALVVYAVTVAPSIPLWDCGEFIACAYTLGVSHPPGAPLFTLIGRLFTLLPFGSTAVMVNWVSVLSSVATVALAAVLISRLVRRAISREGGGSALVGHLAGWAGAVSIAFSKTFWFNATEAEVYGLSALMMLAGVFLAIRWDDLRETDPAAATRRLVMAAYLAFLGTAVHMTVFLFALPVFLFVVISDRTLLRDWRFWVVTAGLSTFVVTIDIFIVALVVFIVATIGMAASSRSAARPRWTLLAALTVVAAVGYSSQAYIPIRSTQDPGIDENNPETWESWKSFLERKQYGQQSMFALMFSRRGSWGNQLGTHRRLGLFGFFREQFSPARTWAFPTALGIFGFVWGLMRVKRRTLLLLALTVLCTVGLVVYINMSDGMRGVILEVRDRDYIFSPGFLAFGLGIGLGVGALLAPVFRRRRDGSHSSHPAARGAGIAFAALLPLVPFVSNFAESDRSGDFVAYEFAHNLLASCRENAILFTNGDNDTFPLWCVQEVDSIRNDVRVVNLSLLQMDWYILQLKNRDNVPIALREGQITTIDTVISGQRMRIPREWYEDPLDPNSPVKLLVPWPTPEGRTMLVSHQMIRQIILANQWRYPVHFSITCGGLHREEDVLLLPLSNHVRREGLVINVVPDSTGPMDVDLTRTERLLFDEFLTGSLPEYWVDGTEAARGLLITYMTTAGIAAADAERRGDLRGSLRFLSWILPRYPGERRVARTILELTMSIGDTPESRAALEAVLRDQDAGAQAALLLADLDFASGDIESALSRRQGSSAIEDVIVSAAYLSRLGRGGEADDALADAQARHPDDQRVALLRAGVKAENGDVSGALDLLSAFVSDNADAREASFTLVKMLISTGRYDEARGQIARWLERHPSDSEFGALLSMRGGTR
jgi:hypothetical protein